MKVLIISHNPITSYHNMGKTLASLFSSFRRDELCQLYIYPTIPDLDFCASYFRITDKDVLRSIFRVSEAGDVVEPDVGQHSMFEHAGDTHLYRNPKNQTAHRRLARDVVWKIGRWCGSDLKQWLDDQQPTVLFVAPGDAAFLYKIALRISKERGIPIITYICDELYHLNPDGNPAACIHHYQLKSSIRALMKKSSLIVTICESLAELYEQTFQVPTVTVMTGSTLSAGSVDLPHETVKRLVYLGNLRCGRAESLAAIGRALDAINRESGQSLSLCIYSAEQESAYLDPLSMIPAVQLCGFVSGEEYERALLGADALVHAESFAPENIALVRYSISTKLADYLASGVPVFAYGPEEIASMRYLCETGSACCVHAECSLKETLLQFVENQAWRAELSSRACISAKQFHCSDRNSEKLYEALSFAEKHGTEDDCSE